MLPRYFQIIRRAPFAVAIWPWLPAQVFDPLVGLGEVLDSRQVKAGLHRLGSRVHHRSWPKPTLHSRCMSVYVGVPWLEIVMLAPQDMVKMQHQPSYFKRSLAANLFFYTHTYIYIYANSLSFHIFTSTFSDLQVRSLLLRKYV